MNGVLTSNHELRFPFFNADVFHTAKGTPYLKHPGVVLIGQTASNIAPVREFLESFDDELGFDQYLEDQKLADIDQLVKFAGQLCYMSFGEKRTKNGEAGKYFDNILSSGHGSVLQHASFSFLVYGADRSFTHECVRHGIGTAFSQVSQRYVSGKTLRFVERPEYQNDPELHAMFERRIDMLSEEYEKLAEMLYERQAAGMGILTADRKTDLRKKVQQAARSCLPNETEAAICVSGNIRALRHIIEMRANEHADLPIRMVGVGLHQCVKQITTLFDDHSLASAKDGTQIVNAKYRKV